MSEESINIRGTDYVGNVSGASLLGQRGLVITCSLRHRHFSQGNWSKQIE